jgi:hypothetical protein
MRTFFHLRDGEETSEVKRVLDSFSILSFYSSFAGPPINESVQIGRA